MRPFRNRFRLASLWILPALAALVPGTAAAQAKPTLDHFKCYITKDEPVNAEVQLFDQFDIGRGFQKALVRQAVRFCNPVEKLHRNRVVPISNPDAHLKMYTIAPSQLDPARALIVENQFGRQRLRIFNPEVLAVPTQKDRHPAPDPLDLDHFKCYRAFGRPARTIVTLKDQFHVEERVKVFEPFGFCNPTRKIHGDRGFGINHLEDHLVCYRISQTPFRRDVFATNQFGVEQLVVESADLLCVPSKKLAVRVIQ